jgi:transposase
VTSEVVTRSLSARCKRGSKKAPLRFASRSSPSRGILLRSFTTSLLIWLLQALRCVGEHPTQRNRKEAICFSPYLYRARNLVERFFDKIKCRRVATRYDKLTANYLAFIQLASIRLWLRVNESTP